MHVKTVDLVNLIVLFSKIFSYFYFCADRDRGLELLQSAIIPSVTGDSDRWASILDEMTDTGSEGTDILHQCCGTVMIYCGSDYDVGQVLVLVPASVPVLDPDGI